MHGSVYSLCLSLWVKVMLQLGLSLHLRKEIYWFFTHLFMYNTIILQSQILSFVHDCAIKGEGNIAQLLLLSVEYCII